MNQGNKFLYLNYKKKPKNLLLTRTSSDSTRCVMKKFIAREKGILTDNDAKLIGRFIEKNFPNGEVTPEELVQAAKPRTSPIHRFFSWDDIKAAALYRLQQARNIIGSIYIEYEDGPDIRAYHHVVIDDEAKYVQHHKTLASAHLWEQVVDKALKELEFWKLRYGQYKQLSGLTKMIESGVKETQWKLKQKKRK